MATETQETTMVTEREAVERERAAFVDACEYTALNAVLTRSRADAIAAERYPLPKVRRPRVVRDPHIPSVEWSAHEPDCIYGREDGGAWELSRPNVSKSAQRVALWADLLANPAEDVTEVTP